MIAEFGEDRAERIQIANVKQKLFNNLRISGEEDFDFSVKSSMLPIRSKSWKKHFQLKTWLILMYANKWNSICAFFQCEYLIIKNIGKKNNLK